MTIGLMSFARASATVLGTLKIGAGGFVTGIAFAADGTKVARCDVYGAYVAAPGTSSLWQQLVTTTALPASATGIDIGQAGVYEIAIAPSNSQRIYMYLGNDGNIYRSDNQGVSFVKTNFTSAVAASNSGDRTMGRFMAVDPQNPDICYAGTPTGGVFVTPDAGVTWTHIAAITNGAPPSTGGILIAFDPSSTVSGGKKQGIYISSYGTGVYHSTDGGTTWALTTTTPTTHQHMMCDQTGLLYLLTAGIDNLYRYNGTAWSHLAITGGRGFHAIAVDPSNPSHFWLQLPTGELAVSLDAGGTLSSPTFGNVVLAAADIPWLASVVSSLSSGDIQFDPNSPTVLYMPSGVGVFHTVPPTSNVSFTFTSQSAGIEELVVNTIAVPLGGKPVVASWDRPLFYVNDPTVYPSAFSPSGSAVIPCWDVDWCSSLPSKLVAIINGQNGASTDESGYSTDGGQTWHPFAALTPSQSGAHTGGGSIASVDGTNICWVSGGNGKLWLTQNGGTTWAVPASLPTDGWGATTNITRKIVCADRSNGKFYAYNTSATVPGVYASSDNGVTWTLVHAGRLYGGGDDNFQVIMKSALGQANNLYITAGRGTGVHPLARSFFESTNGGATWTAVPNVLEVRSFGFGKSNSGGYPSIFIQGWVSSVYGIWRSDDHYATWTKVSDGFPLGSSDQIVCLEGDPNTYGTFYGGWGGSGGNGFFYGKLG